MVGPAEGGFYGLNLHYLPPTLRAKFLDGLMDTMNNKKYDETTKFQINYSMLQRAAKLKYFKACYKHYLNNHVRSPFAIPLLFDTKPLRSSILAIDLHP